MRLPGPSPFGVLRYFPEARRGLLAPLEAIVRDWGDVVRIPFPGDPVYFFRSPEHIRSFLQENDGHYRRSYDDLKRFMGDGLITSDGSSWRKQRKVIAPMFHGPVVAGFFEQMTEESERLANRLKTTADSSGKISFDVEEEMLDVTLRIVTRCLISNDLDATGRRISELMTLMMEHIVARLRSPWRIPFTWPTPGLRRFERALRELDQVIYRLIDARVEAWKSRSESDGRDLLDLLLASKDAETGEPLSRKMVRDEVVTFILAGHETTAHALTWALDLLASHPAEAQRLQTELRHVDLRSASTLMKLPVLNQVYREALRLYPPVWYIERVSTQAHQIGEYDIPEGVRVAVSPYLTHRDPKLWKNPDSFDPSRFDGSTERQSEIPESRWAWIPYGAGPRSCVGQPMAVMQFQTVVARLLQEFTLETEGGKEKGDASRINPLITIRPRKPIRLILTPK